MKQQVNCTVTVLATMSIKPKIHTKKEVTIAWVDNEWCLPSERSRCRSAFLESQQHRLVVFSSGNSTATQTALVSNQSVLQSVIIFGLRFAFFTHISGKKRTVSKYVR